MEFKMPQPGRNELKPSTNLNPISSPKARVTLTQTGTLDRQSLHNLGNETVGNPIPLHQKTVRQPCKIDEIKKKKRQS